MTNVTGTNMVLFDGHSLVPKKSLLGNWPETQETVFGQQSLMDYLSPNIGQATFQNDFLSSATNNVEKLVSALKIPPSLASFPSSSNERTIEEQLFAATANVKILTSQVAMHLDREWREKLFQQLDALHDSDEWEAEDKPIQQASFATFLKAICQIKPRRRPGFGLTHGGHLIAAWTVDQNRLTIEFLSNDRVRWVVSRIYENERDKFAGETSVSRLENILRPYHPEVWFY